MKPGLLALALCFPLCAQALTLRLCQDASQLPLAQADGRGVVDRLVRQAAAESGIMVASVAAARCLDAVRAGQADALPMAAFAAGGLAYPSRKGQPDVARAVVLAQSKLLRRVDMDYRWDGKAVSPAALRLAVPQWGRQEAARGQSLGLRVQFGPPEVLDAVADVVDKRADLVALDEFDGLRALAHPRYGAQLEMLALPFTEQIAYVGVAPAYYQANRAVIEKLWTAIGRLRLSPLYAQALHTARQQAR